MFLQLPMYLTWENSENLQRHQLFPREMTLGKRAQKFRAVHVTTLTSASEWFKIACARC